MKTIICGGRDYVMTGKEFKWLDAMKEMIPITEVVSGAGSGADQMGEIWGRLNLLPVKRFPAAWGLHGRAAGPIRNEEMAKHAQACVVFPGGRGTADMVRRARGHGLAVFEFGKSYCAECRLEMRHNVPRMGEAGGFVHVITGSVACPGWDDFPLGGCHTSSRC